MNSVDAFMERQRKLIEARTEVAREMKKEQELSDEATIKKFETETLPLIADLDAAGTKIWEIGCFSRLPAVWERIAKAHHMWIETGDVEYLTYPAERDYYLKWD